MGEGESRCFARGAVQWLGIAATIVLVLFVVPELLLYLGVKVMPVLLASENECPPDGLGINDTRAARLWIWRFCRVHFKTRIFFHILCKRGV